MGGLLIVLLFVVTTGIGLGVGILAGKKLGYNEAWDDEVGGQEKRRLYREAAVIMDNLIHVNDLSVAEVPVLPKSIEKRIDRWLAAHRADTGIDSKEGK